MTTRTRPDRIRQKAIWGTTVAVSLLLALPGRAAAENPRHGKLDAELSRRATRHVAGDTVDLIALNAPGADLPARFRHYIHGTRFHIIDGYWLEHVPTGLLDDLAGDANVGRLTFNHTVARQDALSSYAVLANAVDPSHAIYQRSYPFTGAGVRVAVIDSGFTSSSTADMTDDRVQFVNFVDRNPLRHDGNGHGTHVAGVIAGAGATSAKYAGIAPAASIVALKVLDDSGAGSIGNVVTALDWIYTHPDLNIRVVNLSVGAPVHESYWTDPLALAAKALVDRGVTVVAAAGNAGLNANGVRQWGGITSPGNAPWVLTVCASSTNGTYDLSDDTIADFSSAGPTAVDLAAKPDICAPGVGIVSLADPGSTLYALGAQSSPSWLIGGSGARFSTSPYESLSGTSFATPFVTGAVALMLQANPALTPNLIKAILEYTATPKAGVSPLKQGAGIMNVTGALALATTYAWGLKPLPGDAQTWGRQFLWGNVRVTGGVIDPRANAWRLGVVWGADVTLGGDNIIWGTADLGLDNIIWGTADLGLDNIIWGTADLGLDNIIWGTADLDIDNIIWGTAGSSNVVWSDNSGAN